MSDMNALMSLRNILGLALISLFLSVSVLNPVSAQEFSDMPYGEPKWKIMDFGGGPSPALLINTSDQIGDDLNFWNLPKKILMDNKILFESAAGFSTFNTTNLPKDGLRIVEEQIFTPGPTENPDRYAYSSVEDFAIVDNHLLTISLEGRETTTVPVIRFFDILSEDRTISLKSSLEPEDMSVTYNRVESCVLQGSFAYVMVNSQSTGTRVLFSIDVSSPDSPFEVGYLEFPDLQDTQRKTHDMIAMGDLLMFYDGTSSIRLVNITSPSEMTELDNLSLTSLVYNMDLQDSRLFLAVGNHGLLTYNVTETAPYFSIISNFTETAEKAVSVKTVDASHVCIGNSNGTIQIVNVSETGAVSQVSRFDAPSFSAMDVYDDTLVIGTKGLGYEGWNISDAGSPTKIGYWPISTSGTGSPRFEFLSMMNTKGESWNESVFSNLEMYYSFISKDSANISRWMTTNIWTSYFIVYNDTNQDGLLTLDITRDPDNPQLVTSLDFLDDVYATPLFDFESVNYTDPVVRSRGDAPALYYTVNYEGYRMGAETADFSTGGKMYGLPPSFSQIENDNLSISFDVMYGFWVWNVSNNFFLKIDMEITNWNATFGSADIPNSLNLFSGFMTSVMGIFGSTGMPISTSVSPDSATQTFGQKGSVFAVSTMAKNYTSITNEFSNTSPCEVSSIPRLLDEDYQRVYGDSDEVYQWVIGPSFSVTKETKGFEYDPELVAYGAPFASSSQSPTSETTTPHHGNSVTPEPGILAWAAAGGVTIIVVVILVKRR